MKAKNNYIAGCVISIIFFLMGNCIHPSQTLTKGKKQGPPAKHLTHVKLPRGYRLSKVELLHYKSDGIIIDIFSKRYAQGMAGYIEIYQSPFSQVARVSIQQILFNNKHISLTEKSWGWRGIFGIDPEMAPGVKKIVVDYTIRGNRRRDSFPISIEKTEYQFYPNALDLGNYSDVDYQVTAQEAAFIEKCSAKKKIVFSRSGPDRLKESLAHPRNRHFITSPFWSKRLIMRYRKKNGTKIMFKDKLNVHMGIDLRGKTGEPVYAMSDGIIAIAEPMYYEGNFIVIDHGNRIFSYYMHLNALKVNEGDIVKGGDMIGCVGSTGLSTAAHLHVSIKIQDIQVDPMSFLVLPIRD